MPVVRSYNGTRTIEEMRINESTDWRTTLSSTVAQSYARAPQRKDVLPMINALIGERAARLSEYNIHAIRALADALKLGSNKMILASELPVSGLATDRLVAIVKAVGGDVYLSGGGAGGYQDDKKFAEAGIELRYQDFRHPTYRQVQVDEFVSGLSIIDALMSCGIAGTAALFDRTPAAKGL